MLAAAAGLCGIALWMLGGGGLRGAALVLLLVLMALAMAAAGWLAGRRRGERGLHDARLQAQLLSQLNDGWQWQTDAEHRLVRLQPPRGAPASAWSGSAHGSQLLWQRFADEGSGLQQRLQAQDAFDDVEVAPAGGERWRLSARPRLDTGGRFAGHVGMARLQPAAAAEPAPARDAVDDEQAAFVYTLSHDLRAPIRVVEGFARILKEDHGPALDRVGQDHLDRVLGAAARMNQMIDAMLSLSRLSTQPLARQSVDLSQLAGFILDDLRRASPQRTVTVEVEPELRATGDPTLLRLVLENLLGNAWKYSVRNAAAHIALRRERRDGQDVFVVADNGAGFDMRFADRLFGLFQRLHGASEFPGTGVGLASVRRIVRRHGGQIWAESEVGQGARFYFTLPAPT